MTLYPWWTIIVGSFIGILYYGARERYTTSLGGNIVVCILTRATFVAVFAFTGISV